MNFSAPPADILQRKSAGAQDLRHREHRRVFLSRGFIHIPYGNFERAAFLFDLRYGSDPGRFVDREAHDIVRGKHGERPHGKAFGKRAFPPIGHCQLHRRVDPGERKLAFGHRSDRAKTARGERDRDALAIVALGSEREFERVAERRIGLQHPLGGFPRLRRE